jgi:hypothetical protein
MPETNRLKHGTPTTVFHVYYIYIFHFTPHREKYVSTIRINQTLKCGDVDSKDTQRTEERSVWAEGELLSRTPGGTYKVTTTAVFTRTASGVTKAYKQQPLFSELNIWCSSPTMTDNMIESIPTRLAFSGSQFGQELSQLKGVQFVKSPLIALVQDTSHSYSQTSLISGLLLSCLVSPCAGSIDLFTLNRSSALRYYVNYNIRKTGHQHLQYRGTSR